MTQTKTSATSAVSLGAITVGAVAAAVLFMSIGSIVTIISIGATLNNGTQVTAALDDHKVASFMRVSTGDKIHKKNFKNEKNYFLDAVLREDFKKTPAKSVERGSKQPIPGSQIRPEAKVNQPKADPYTKELSFHNIWA